MLKWLEPFIELEAVFFNWNLSRWLLIASVVLMGTQMYPGFAALVVMTINILLLILLRWVAKREAEHALIREEDDYLPY
jgi:type III secretory pathway component EscV